MDAHNLTAISYQRLLLFVNAGNIVLGFNVKEFFMFY